MPMVLQLAGVSYGKHVCEWGKGGGGKSGFDHRPPIENNFADTCQIQAQNTINISKFIIQN